DPPDTDATSEKACGVDTERYTHDGLPVVVLREPLRLRGYTFEHEYYHPGMKAEFCRIVEEFKPDILHSFHLQNLSGSIIELANERNLPIVCSATDFWFVCPIVQLKLPDGSVCRGPNQGAKNCLSCYTPKLLPEKNEFARAFSKKYAMASSVL